jgi:hypothetical protein
MAFKKGVDSKRNTSGRPKGAPNKTTAEIKEIITRIVGNQLDRLEADLDKVRKDDPIEAMKLATKLIDYVLPKQTKMELDGQLTQRVEKVIIEIKKNDSKHTDDSNI